MAVRVSIDLEYEPRDRKTIASSRRKHPCLMTDDVELLKVGQACGRCRVWMRRIREMRAS